MLDSQLLRNDLDNVKARLKKRGFKLDTVLLENLENKRKELQSRTQQLQNERNTRSKSIGQAKAKGEDIQPLLDEVASLGDELKAAEGELRELQGQLNDILMGIPNLPHGSVPDGLSEEDNQEVRKWGTPKAFEFEAHDHVDLGEQCGLMDFETAAKLTGSRFAVMSGAIARLHRALIQFMLDLHVGEHGLRSCG